MYCVLCILWCILWASGPEINVISSILSLVSRIIEQTSALLDKLSLDINLNVRFLITAAQLGTRFTVNISLALQ